MGKKLLYFFFSNRELKSGTLSENGVQNGGEIRLIPSLESGVNVSSRK